MRITSSHNPEIKRWAKLKTRRGRERENAFIVEGIREIERALAGGVKPLALIYWPEGASTAERDLLEQLRPANPPLLEVAEFPFRKLAYRESPSGLMLVARHEAVSLEDLELAANPLVLIAVGLEKPGNLGAILRSADAAPADAVVLAGEGLELHNPNVIRSSTGVIFHLPVAQAPEIIVRAWLRDKNLKAVAATPHGSARYWDTDLGGPTAIIVGPEDRGLDATWLAAARTQVRIPMSGIADSLNVSVSAALLLFEALRQRRSA